ncbi:MAG: hypothetical protein EBU90_27385 [Proteobacteria bacterium]|nr:hypothetical protein [Pseudomonadota bacterium]
MSFTIDEIHWRDQIKPEYKQAILVLNTLSEEQIQAVKLFGLSRYDDGYDDGFSGDYAKSRYERTQD